MAVNTSVPSSQKYAGLKSETPLETPQLNGSSKVSSSQPTNAQIAEADGVIASAQRRAQETQTIERNATIAAKRSAEEADQNEAEDEALIEAMSGNNSEDQEAVEPDVDGIRKRGNRSLLRVKEEPKKKVLKEEEDKKNKLNEEEEHKRSGKSEAQVKESEPSFSESSERELSSEEKAKRALASNEKKIKFNGRGAAFAVAGAAGADLAMTAMTSYAEQRLLGGSRGDASLAAASGLKGSVGGAVADAAIGLLPGVATYQDYRDGLADIKAGNLGSAAKNIAAGTLWGAADVAAAVSLVIPVGGEAIEAAEIAAKAGRVAEVGAETVETASKLKSAAQVAAKTSKVIDKGVMAYTGWQVVDGGMSAYEKMHTPEGQKLVALLKKEAAGAGSDLEGFVRDKLPPDANPEYIAATIKALKEPAPSQLASNGRRGGAYRSAPDMAPAPSVGTKKLEPTLAGASLLPTISS